MKLTYWIAYIVLSQVNVELPSWSEAAYVNLLSLYHTHPTYPWEANLQIYQPSTRRCQFDRFPSATPEDWEKYLDESRQKWKISKQLVAWLETPGGGAVKERILCTS